MKTKKTGYWCFYLSMIFVFLLISTFIWVILFSLKALFSLFLVIILEVLCLRGFYYVYKEIKRL